MICQTSLLLAESFGSPLDWLAVAISLMVLGPLLVGFVLVVRDTIRQRGKWGINHRRPTCGECGEKMPVVRKPVNWQQALWGGWTCSECGLEMDKWGQPVESQATLAKFAVLKAAREAEREREEQAQQDKRIRRKGQPEYRADDQAQ